MLVLMPVRFGFAASILALLVSLPRAQSDWTWQYPLPQGNPISGLTWTGTQMIAVGDHGTLLTSPDGLAWTLRPTGTTRDLRAVAWSGSRYVVVGAGVILTSEDGLAWESKSLPNVSWMMGVAWTGKVFVIVGMDGKIFTSPDGLEWTPRESGVTTWLWSVTWTGTRLIAVGHNGAQLTGTLLTSTDGETWSQPSNLGFNYLFGVTWTGTQAVAVGDSIYTSPDGLEWTPQPFSSFSRLESVTRAGNRIVGVGTKQEVAREAGLVMIAEDGVTWTAHVPEGFGKPLAVAWTGSRIVVAGDQGFIATSENGETWTIPWRHVATWQGLAHSPTHRIAVGLVNRTDAVTAVSANGQPWEIVPMGKEPGLRKAVWHGSRFVAVGDSGRIFTSPDGRVWTRRASGTSYALLSIATSGSMVVVGGEAGTLLTSPDGIDWTPRNRSTLVNASIVLWAGNRFLAFSDSVYASADGLTWAGLARNTGFFEDIAWSGSRYVGVARTGALSASSNALTWTVQYDRSNTPLRGVAWSGQAFAAIGELGTVLTSPDGLAWTFHPEAKSPPTDLHLQDILWDGRQYLVAGQAGAILTSFPDPTSIAPRLRQPPTGGRMRVEGNTGSRGYILSGQAINPASPSHHGVILRVPRKE